VLRTKGYAAAVIWAIAALAAPAPGAGPDVIVGDLPAVMRWGWLDGITAYSVGTTSCNVGDTPLNWVGSTADHPVIAQNLYRLAEGRFEQVGMAWVKHGFSALTENLCDTCTNPGTSSLLGVGCSDPYNAGLNGNQFGLGPRSEINATTGVFPYPFTPAPGDPLNRPSTALRVQVHDADIDPDSNPGAAYFVEGHYVAADDAAAGNALNNASYRRVFVTEQNAPSTIWTIGVDAMIPTVREKAAIWAWQELDPEVTISNVDVPGDGRFIVGVKVTDEGDNFWTYDYAVQNLNSHRSARSFSLFLDDTAVVGSDGFHDIDYHSGEPYDGMDWAFSHAGGSAAWSTDDFDTNADANALRWATLYNFRLTTNSPPTPFAEVTLGLFRSGAPASVAVTTWGPQAGPIDCDSNGTPDSDEIAMDPSLDCNSNGILDACDPDCDGSGTADACEILLNPMLDCNGNGVLDTCEIDAGSTAPGGPFFCTANCNPDCNDNGVPDDCDIADMTELDCNGNGTPDSCESANDCNANDTPDECEIDENSTAPGGPFYCPMDCDPDCNDNGVPDGCDISGGAEADCNGNLRPDSCDIADTPSLDCNSNGVIDACSEFNCNANALPDDCEYPACPGILKGDMDCNGIVNFADVDPFIAEIMNGTSPCQTDFNGDTAIDALDLQGFTDAI
jgi:hypothetical protein